MKYKKGEKYGLYFNTQYSDKIATIDMVNTLKTMYIGAYDTGGYDWFSGRIDSISVYNDAIPTSQIYQNYYSGLNQLFANNSFRGKEYSERLSQLKNNLANDNM
jgi:hypothetical protein